MPRSQGGSDHFHNLASACAACNNARGDLFEAVEFYEMIVGLRPLKRMPKQSENPEHVAKKLASRETRQHQLVVDMAVTVMTLKMMEWVDSWLTYSVPMLKQE